MKKDNLDSLLGLLAMTIFADKKVLSEEIKAFVGSVKYLQSMQVVVASVSEADIIMWYELNKDELKTKVTGKGFEIWLRDCLGNLSTVKNKPAILIAMGDIANADEEVHVSEVALVALVAKHWGLKW